MVLTKFQLYASETVFGFFFWSLFHGFAPFIWFYPLNKMAVSGYELYFMVVTIPFILRYKSVLFLFSTKFGWTIIHCGMLVGVASFKAPTTLSRLTCLTIGNAGAMLRLAFCLKWRSSEQKSIFTWGLISGYMLLLTSRIIYLSISPLWSDSTSNAILIEIFVINCFWRFHYFQPGWHFSKEPGSTDISLSLGFGTLLFLQHWLFGEITVLARWTVQSYPTSGPPPLMTSALTLVALTLGMVVISLKESLITSKFWSLLSLGAFYHGYFYSGWTSLAGLLVVAIYFSSILPHFLDQISKSNVSVSLPYAGFAYCFYILFCIWTTAYNFVPGGSFTRERTDVLIFLIMITLTVALSQFRENPKLSRSDINIYRKVPSIFITICLMVGLSAIAARNFAYNPSVRLSKPGKPITAIVWNIHFCYDNHGWPTFERVTDTLKKVDADFIALLETETSRPYMGSNDIGQWFAEKLGYHLDYGPSTKTHTWGNMLLSRYPIIYSEHHLLPSPHGELAPALSAVVNVSDTEQVLVVVTHMGNDVDDLDRRLQAEYLANVTGFYRSQGMPVIFLSYITCLPGSRDYMTFINSGKMLDIDETDKDRFCEYIFYGGLNRLAYARISHGGLSDTEAQAAKFIFPADDHTVLEEYVPINESEASNEIKFPSTLGTVLYGHYSGPERRYHMGTPKYFGPVSKQLTTNYSATTLNYNLLLQHIVNFLLGNSTYNRTVIDNEEGN